MERSERELLIQKVLKQLLKDLTVGQLENAASLIENLSDAVLKQYVSKKDDSK